MRLTAAEKQEIIMLVERSEIGVNRTLLQLGINKSTFYKWYKIYLDKGSIGLELKRELIRSYLYQLLLTLFG